MKRHHQSRKPRLDGLELARLTVGQTRARKHLAKMLPYATWTATAGKSRLETAARLSGSPLAFYRDMLDQTIRLARLDDRESAEILARMLPAEPEKGHV